MNSVPHASPTSATASRAPLRSFGRFRLLRLLGKSHRTMCWQVGDPNTERDLVLVLPRMQFTDAAAAPRWAQAVRRAGRLQHPNLAVPIEIGVHENWPFVAYEISGRATLADRIGGKGLATAEAASIFVDVLEGLAYAHDAGAAHRDLQCHFVLVDDQGHACVAGLEVAGVGLPVKGNVVVKPEQGSLQAQRDAAELDVLAAGLMLHHALVGQPPLDEADVGAVIGRMPPSGPELVRLPFATTTAIPEVLRTIANRAADRQERQRYRNARTFSNALEAWLRSDRNGEDGPLNALLDRMSSIGMLPAAPDGTGRASRLAGMESQRTNDLAALVIEDMALAFELLRLVNAAQSRSAQSGNGTSIVTVRRAIAMLGMEGLRRAAQSLRVWPGSLNEALAEELARMMERVKRGARLAVALRPSGFDPEVVALLTMLQNLGRLLLQYHCGDEALQIRRLMAAAPPERPGEPPQPGMTEEAAAYSVIGTDIEAVGVAVAKRWGFDDEILSVLRRWPLQSSPRTPENDAEQLRLLCSCANELIDIHLLPAPQQAQALNRIAQRYGRVMHLQPKDLAAALQESATSTLAAVLLEGSGNSMFSLDTLQGDPDTSRFR